MKNKTALKVAFWANAVLSILALLGGGTLLQASPFVLFVGLVGAMVWGKRNYKVAAIIIAGLMALLNLSLSSGPDTLVWVINIVLVLL